MTSIVSICCTTTGDVFHEIEYTDFNDLEHKLKLLIIRHNSDLLITLLINEHIINNYDIINMILLSKLNNYDTITIIFNKKKELYCLDNVNGKYILAHKNDNYHKLLNIIIDCYEDNSYNTIMNNSYKNLVLKAVEQNGASLEFASIDLQNDKEVVLEAIKEYGYSLNFASINLQNNKEFILECVKQNGYVLQYTINDLKNDKEIVLEAVKQNGNALRFTNKILQNNKEIVLKAVKQKGSALKFANINLQNDKEIVLEAVKQNGYALQFTNTNNNLRNDKDIIFYQK